MLADGGAQATGPLLTCAGEWNIGASGVLAGEAPCCLAVANQNDLVSLRHHGSFDRGSPLWQNSAAEGRVNLEVHSTRLRQPRRR